jgi:hypothetical protein
MKTERLVRIATALVITDIVLLAIGVVAMFIHK